MDALLDEVKKEEHSLQTKENHIEDVLNEIAEKNKVDIITMDEEEVPEEEESKDDTQGMSNFYQRKE